MLVLMTITHVPTRYSNWLGQPFGFVSAAEGFVFLSAWMVGAVYSARAVEKGIDAMRSALWQRARLVWLCQAALLVFLFTVIADIGVLTHRRAITNLLSFYLAEPIDALWSSLLMVYKPPLLDILPMYVIFMLASPLLLTIGFRRNGWRAVILASVVLWLLAQFGLNRELYVSIATATHWKMPVQQTGAFELFAWQLPWIVGMWMGSRSVTSRSERAFPEWIVALAVIYAIACLAWRHAVGQTPFPPHTGLNWLFDKWNLGPLRLADFFALALIAVRFGPALAARLRLGVLETMGRASLPVFCSHIVASLLVLAAIGDSAGRVPLWTETVILAAVLSCLYGTAVLCNRFGGRKPRQASARRLSAGMAG